MSLQTSPQSLLEHALSSTTSPECVVIVQQSSSANLRWANNTLTTNGVMTSTTVTVVAVRDGAPASISGTAATAQQVEHLVAAADAAAVLARPAEDRQPLVAGGEAADWGEPPASTSIEVYTDVARALGEEFDRAAAERRLLYGFVNHELTSTYLGSTTGLRLRHVQSTGHYGCTAKPADLSSSAWVGGATRDFTDVDAHAMAASLETRLGWAHRSVDLPAGRYDTVLPPTAVADLMIDAYWSAGARDARDGQSVFSRRGGGTRLGERVARPGVRLFSDPSYPGLESAAFATVGVSSGSSSVFDNGLALGRSDWVTDGTLTSLVHSRHTAEQMGQPATLGTDNLVLEVDGATGGLDELVADVEHGLLLTCLWYIREVDPQTLLMTGLTRDGVYLVEGGEITGVVNNFRFNERPVDLLRRFTTASATVPTFSREWGEDDFSRTAMPALRVPDFNMSSTSQAR